jgi:hypothetical protein
MRIGLFRRQQLRPRSARLRSVSRHVVVRKAEIALTGVPVEKRNQLLEHSESGGETCIAVLLSTKPVQLVLRALDSW